MLYTRQLILSLPLGWEEMYLGVVMAERKQDDLKDGQKDNRGQCEGNRNPRSYAIRVRQFRGDSI